MTTSEPDEPPLTIRLWTLWLLAVVQFIGSAVAQSYGYKPLWLPLNAFDIVNFCLIVTVWSMAVRIIGIIRRTT